MVEMARSAFFRQHLHVLPELCHFEKVFLLIFVIKFVVLQSDSVIGPAERAVSSSERYLITSG